MNEMQKYALHNGATLYILFDMVAFVSSDGERQPLTLSQQKILYMLAMNLKHGVTSEQLYKYYTGNEADHTAPSRCAKMISQIRKLDETSISFIVSKNNRYFLLGDDFSKRLDRNDTTSTQHDLEVPHGGRFNWNIDDVMGDYIGLYTEPKGTGFVHGMRLSIRKDDSGTPRVFAINSISNIETLVCDETKAVLYASDICSAHKTWMQKHPGSTRGSRLFGGVLEGRENLLEFKMTHANSPHQIMLILDLEKYLVFTQSERHCEYRGGLGLEVVTGDNLTGTYVTRLGLIKTKYFTDISMDDERLKHFLQLETGVGTAKLNIKDDQLWFEWFYKKYERMLFSTQ